MKTNQIRSQITKAIQQEKQTGNLSNALNAVARFRIGRPLNNQEMQSHISLITAYIEYIPDVIDHAESMAAKEGYLDKVKPLLTKIVEYFTQPNDFIPDELGLVGLMDDAYLAHVYLMRISGILEAKTGNKLLQDATSNVTQFIRNLIGEPVATNIDNYINGQSVDGFLAQLMALANAGQFASFGSSFNDSAIRQQVDTQMALVTSSYSPSW